MQGWSAYTWVSAYFVIISVEMAYGKHIVGPHLGLKSMWGPTMYTNVLSIVPMSMAGALSHEHERLAQATWSVSLVALLAISCVIGVAISYTGWKCRSMVTATSLLHGSWRGQQDGHRPRQLPDLGQARLVAWRGVAVRLSGRRESPPWCSCVWGREKESFSQPFQDPLLTSHIPPVVSAWRSHGFEKKIKKIECCKTSARIEQKKDKKKIKMEKQIVGGSTTTPTRRLI